MPVQRTSYMNVAFIRARLIEVGTYTTQTSTSHHHITPVTFQNLANFQQQSKRRRAAKIYFTNEKRQHIFRSNYCAPHLQNVFALALIPLLSNETFHFLVHWTTIVRWVRFAEWITQTKSDLRIHMHIISEKHTQYLFVSVSPPAEYHSYLRRRNYALIWPLRHKNKNSEWEREGQK